MTTLRKIVFWEVDTQADFMLPGGKLYVPGAEKTIPECEAAGRRCAQGARFPRFDADATLPTIRNSRPSRRTAFAVHPARESSPRGSRKALSPCRTTLHSICRRIFSITRKW